MQTWILFALAVLNLFAFVYVGMDKNKSIAGKERYSEVSFFFIGVFFASLGVLLGMLAFRHKTRKFVFTLSMMLLLLQQVFLLLSVINKP